MSKKSPPLQRRSRFADEAHREAGCTGKIRYGDEATAKLKLAAMRKRHKHVDSTLAPYHCKFCQCWHLGRNRRRGGAPPR